MDDRIIGSNAHGNKNELNLVKALNNKTFSSLNNNLKEFIKYIARDNNLEIKSDTKIRAEYESKTLKQDIYIYIEENKYGISCKMGSGNSVHQEKCEDFINYIKKDFSASEEVCNDFRFFIWSDGTLDGSGSTEKDSDGNIISRFTGKEFQKKYPEKVKNIQKFLDLNKRELIKHFLFVGRHNSSVDYIYHGNENNGRWMSAKELIDLNMISTGKSAIHVGKMSLQSWNISKKGNTEKKRGQLQVKYAKMKDDIFDLMLQHTDNINTFIGDKEEFDISSRFNKNKGSSVWKMLTNGIDNIDDIFMVKVSERVISKLSGKKVYPKADAFLVRANLSQTFLLEHEYELTEKDLKNIDYQPLANTGVSVKINGSKNYTIQKLTYESFIKAFSNILDNAKFIFLALLLYSNDSEKYKNYKMMENLHIEQTEFAKYFEEKIKSNINLEDIHDLSKVRSYAQQYLKMCIKNNEPIYSSLFTGSDWFDEPYVAHFIYLNHELLKNNLVDFTITTGSGRSKGNYSIEIKPV